MILSESKLRMIIRQSLLNEMPDQMTGVGPGEASSRETTDEEKLNHAWNKVQYAEHDQEKRDLGREFEFMKSKFLKKKQDSAKWFRDWQKSHRKKMSLEDLKSETGWSPKKDDGKTQEYRYAKSVLKKYMSMLDNPVHNYIFDWMKETDPTGVLTWPELAKAHREYKKNPTEENALKLGLTGAALVPFTSGKGGIKLADALMNKKSLNMMKKASRQNVSGKITDNKALMQALDSAGKNKPDQIKVVKDVLKVIDDHDIVGKVNKIQHVVSSSSNATLKDVIDAHEKLK